jgi:glycosyltransferase involved in cell wall biosynthesis
LHLLLAGDIEERDKPPRATLDAIQSHPRIHALGWLIDTRPCLAAIDFFVLPTHREGFGTVLLEAAAMGAPVITTDEAGWWGEIVPNEDALNVAVGDVAGLRQAIERMAVDTGLRARLAGSARSKVAEHFDCRRVWSLQEQEFRRIVGR